MRRNANFHNVPWTLASHHQKLVGMDIIIDGEGHFFGKCEDYSVNESHTPFAVKYTRWCNILCDATPLGENSKIQSIKKITMAGRKCKMCTVFLRQLPNHCKQAVFFRIADAIISDHSIYFIMDFGQAIEVHSDVVLFDKDIVMVRLRKPVVEFSECCDEKGQKLGMKTCSNLSVK